MAFTLLFSPAVLSLLSGRGPRCREPISCFGNHRRLLLSRQRNLKIVFPCRLKAARLQSLAITLVANQHQAARSSKLPATRPFQSFASNSLFNSPCRTCRTLSGRPLASHLEPNQTASLPRQAVHCAYLYQTANSWSRQWKNRGTTENR